MVQVARFMLRTDVPTGGPENFSLIVHSSVSEKDDLDGESVLGTQIRTKQIRAIVYAHRDPNRRVLFCA